MNIFEKIGVFIHNNRITILLIFFLFILLSMQGAQKIYMKSGTDTFVGKDTLEYQTYDHIYKRLFGSEMIVVIVEGNNIKSSELIKATDRLEKQLEFVDGVIGVTGPASSIKNINYGMTGRSKIPDTDEEVQTIVDGNPTIFGRVIPDDTHMVIAVEMDGASSKDKQKEILAITERSVKFSDFPPSYIVRVTGDPAFDIAMSTEMTTSMGPLLGLAAVFMLIILSFVFGHVRWRLLPLPIVLIGIMYTFGAMGFLEIPLSMVSMSAFPVLIGLGIDYAIQFHNRIEEELHKEGNKSKAIIQTVKHTGPAVLIAVSMTILGFISLFTSTVPMIQDFGKLLTIGVLMCYLASLFIGVVTVYSFDSMSGKFQLRKGKDKSKLINKNTEKASSKKAKGSPIENAFKKLNDFTIKYSVLVIVIASVFCVAGLFADEKVGINTDTQSFVPQDMPALVDLNHMKGLIGGTDELNLVIKVKDSADPEVLKWIDKFSEHELNRARIYGATSIVTFVKQYNGGKIPETQEEIEAVYDKIPESMKDRYLYGNNMLLLTFNIGDAQKVVKATGVEELREIVQEDVQWTQPPPDTTVTITGTALIYSSILTALSEGRIAMTYIGLFLVLGGLLVVYRDWLKALVPIISMFMVTGWSGLVMKSLNIDYTPMTATLGALILGIGCEFSILMMERYFEEKDKGASPLEAIHRTSESTGAALLASGATVVGGFAALTIAPFPLISDFGTITVIDILLVLVSTFVVFPPLMIVLDSWREKKKGVHASNAKTKTISGADI